MPKNEDTTQFASIEQKRVALRRALYDTPDDPRLLKARDELTNQQAIHAAANKGTFISYNRSDELFAFELAVRLNDYGIETWLDTINVREELGWHEQVARALRRCGLMLAVISPDALEDPDTTNEWARFMAAGKLLIPIVHLPSDLSIMKTWLEPVDFTKRFNSGIQQLRLILDINASV